MSVFARGLLTRLVTRVYFPDESAANATDPAREALDPDNANARRDGGGSGLRFDIHLQGTSETVFFDR